MRTKFLRIAVVFMLALCTAHFALAQIDSARLQGTVTDQNDAVVAGATVAVTNVGTGRVTTATTNELGYYAISGLAPGSYRVEVSQKDFKKSVRELELQVAQIGVADFKLELGAVTESVVVEAGSPVINPGDSAIGDVVESRQVTELPLNGRNFTQLATLVPGVTRGVPTASATGAGGNAETFRNGETGGAALDVNGLRPQNNNFTLDGIDNNEALVNTIVFFPNAEAIDEFRVQTSVAPAQYGRAGGALVITSIKSGTNDFHGSAFWFNRNTNLNARDFFNNGPTPGYNRNQFGGTLGGPIIKNKLFFFVDYQGLRKRIPGSNDTATVPTTAMRNGDFSELLNIPCASNQTGLTPPNDPNVPGKNVCDTNPSPNATFSINVLDPTTGLPFAGNMIPTGRQNAVGLAYINAFPAPNCSPTVDSRCHTIEQNYRNVRKINETWNDFDVRGDYIVDTSNSIFVRVSRGRVDQTETPRLTTLPSGFGSGTNFNYPWGAAVGWTDTINPSILNEARIGFVRTEYGNSPPFNGVNLCTQLGIVNCNTPLLGGIALIGGYNGQLEYTGDYGLYIVPQTGYQASDTVTWTKGRHTFKAGASFLKRELNLFRPLAGKGYFAIAGNGSGGCCGIAGGVGHVSTGYEVSDLLAGFVDGYGHGTSTGTVGTRTWESGLFVQDDWRISPKLTLNLGLRYDILTWPYEVKDRQANFDLTTGALVLPNQNGYPRELVNNNWKNFGPRVGFAYQLGSGGKTVVRGGFGLFYFLDRGGISNQLAQNPPFAGSNAFTYGGGYRITLSGQLPCSPNCTQADLNSTTAITALPSGDFTNLDLAHPTGVSVISVLKNNPTSSVAQWNLQVQRQVGVNSSVSLAYVGTHGMNLTRNYNANQGAYGTQAGTSGFQLYPALGSITVQDNSGTSDYHSLQAQYERRFFKGLQFLGSFTWSKTIDDSCGDLDACAPQTYTNYNLERGLSNIDQSYRLVLSSLYQLPVGRGMHWGHDWSRPVDWILGGWQINGIYALQSGLPFSVCVDGNPAGNCVTRADIVGSPSVHPGTISPGFYFNTAAFVAPPQTTFGTAPNTFTTYSRPGNSARDLLRGPGLSNLDLSIFKNFSLTERMVLQIRGQAYNISNTPHFANPNADLSQGNFGKITSTIPFSFRTLELGARLTF
jgi:hypothetical protein